LTFQPWEGLSCGHEIPIASTRPGSNNRRAFGSKPLLSDCSSGQAAEKSGVSAKLIRYYESIGLVRPAARSAANYRSYDHVAIQTLCFIARARLLGFSIEEISRLLDIWLEPERSSADVKALALAHVADLNTRITALHGMTHAIEDLARQCCGDDGPERPIINDLSGDDRQPPK
jgi:MerR family copper efflux transcriptional regulator